MRVIKALGKPDGLDLYGYNDTSGDYWRYVYYPPHPDTSNGAEITLDISFNGGYAQKTMYQYLSDLCMNSDNDC